MKCIHSKSFIFCLIIMFIIYIINSGSTYSQCGNSKSEKISKVYKVSDSRNIINAHIKEGSILPEEDYTYEIIVAAVVITAVIVYLLVSSKDKKEKPPAVDTLGIKTFEQSFLLVKGNNCEMKIEKQNNDLKKSHLELYIGTFDNLLGINRRQFNSKLLSANLQVGLRYKF